MTLVQLLSERRDAIMDQWFQSILETYPPDARKFLGHEADSIANPVGTTLRRQAETILALLLQEKSAEEISPHFTKLVKIRAVQDFRPAAALGFIFRLKTAARAALGEEVGRQGLHDQLHDFETRIDRLALEAFNKYMGERERTYEIRANELRRRSEILLRRYADLDLELAGTCPSRLEDEE